MSKSCDYELMMALHPVGEYLMEIFKWGLPAFQIRCFSLLHDWINIYFQTTHFADFEKFKIDCHFPTLSKLELTLLFYFKWLWTGHSYFTDFGQKIPKSWGIKIWVPQLINRLHQMFNLLFLSVPCLSD